MLVIPPSSGGISPVSMLSYRPRVVKPVKRPREGGMGPESLFCARLMRVKLVKLPRAAGMGPERLLLRIDKEVSWGQEDTSSSDNPPVRVVLSMFSDCMLTKPAKLSGIGPDMKLAPMLRLVRLRFPRQGGMTWLKALSNRSKVCKEVDPQNWSMGPVNWLSAKLMDWRAGRRATSGGTEP
jgi:hypothetical protein